jgi:sugar lactone lactonase YvrE
LKNLLINLVLACSLTLGSLPALAQTAVAEDLPDNVPALLVKANEAFLAQDHPLFRRVMERLHEMRPYNSEYMYQLVIAYALLDEKQRAYDLMLSMQQQGLSYDFSISDTTLNIRGTEVFDYVNELMRHAGEPTGEAEPVFTLPDSVLMPESIAWDESRQKYLVGTVVEGQVLAVGEDGQVSELLKADNENGLWSVIDIVVDQPRKRLWVSSAAITKFKNYSPVDKGRSALFEFDFETLELIRRYPVPVDGRPHVLGNMAMSSEGDIYIADRTLPIIYKKQAGGQKLVAVMASRDMISLRGVAVKPDGSILYVADREKGILVVDLTAKQAMNLVVPGTLNLGGIDGMYLWENNLVIIQNGIKPQRVMRLQLDDSGTQVTAVRPLAVAQPDFDFPSYGFLKGKDLYYFANSHWSDETGPAKAVKVLRTSMDANENLIAPEMLLYLEQQRQREEQQAAQKAEKQEEDSGSN